MTNPYISVISPVYKAEKIVDELVIKIESGLKQFTQKYEIILVEDGSPDNSWERIKYNCSINKSIKGIRLSRNFGQHQAITAGIVKAKGEYIVVMDCDLQDNPIYIEEMFNNISKGYDIVYTIKEARKHSKFKNITAIIYNKVFNYLTDNKSNQYNNLVGAYSMINRKVADAFINYKDYRRHYLLVLGWLGFKITHIKVEHNNRFEGKSSYTFYKLISHALDGIVSQSDKLLRIFISLGLLISAISIASIILIITLYFVHGFKSGWASTISVILFSTGLITTNIGIIGIYLGRTFEQTKNRPIFIIDEELN